MAVAFDVLLQFGQVLRLAEKFVAALAEHGDDVVVFVAGHHQDFHVLVVLVDVLEDGGMTQVVDLQYNDVDMFRVQQADGMLGVFGKKTVSLVQIEVFGNLFLGFRVIVNEENIHSGAFLWLYLVRLITKAVPDVV
jgi:hypothetical protein